MAEPRVLDRQAKDQLYLHRDFHGALCYAIRYLDERFGAQAVSEYLTRVGETVFASLSDRIQRQGLEPLAEHIQHVMEQENGRFQISRENDKLVVVVHECPAISHLRRTGQLYTERFCETTVWVNQAICRRAGYSSSCTYLPGQGRCVQKFWREKAP
ncbi:hypothetical protein JW992_13170 [candidate division KSB1 bacterium]|nr:hypothetical protein [candidate division KSB1 bacterium]